MSDSRTRMFGIFTSAQKRARHDAHNWLHLAGKIYHFRRDQLPVQEIEALQLAEHELRTRLKERADAAKLKMGMEKLEGCLRRSGGTFYPKSSMVDNVEFFLVAMILFLGIRAFIVQPFKIPTNSMWPTYNGLTAEVFVDEALATADQQDTQYGTIALKPETKRPGTVESAFRWVLFGASPRRVTAPIDGEIFLPYAAGYQLGQPGGRAITAEKWAPERVRSRKWIVIPDQAKQFTIFVGDRPLTVKVPADFRFDLLVENTFFPKPEVLDAALDEARRSQRTAQITATAYDAGTGRMLGPQRMQVHLLATGRRVRAGAHALAFDVMTGDQLFVDRVSYHFVPPKVGDGFVFRTHNIRNIEVGQEYSDKYYIKRLVGIPGDTIQIRPPGLFRNGAPIQGAAAFDKNARREGGYPGYTLPPSFSKIFTKPTEPATVIPDGFMAMGDNSPDSADSRYWGFVPAADVVGRPLWVYFPFTRRWGPAR